MKFTILENAVNSLDIAIENFQLFYYGEEDSLSAYSDSKHKKISLSFLENAIELLLKAIIIEKTKDSLSIFLKTDREPFKQIVDEARELSEKNGLKLEDCLIQNTSMKTITYTQSVRYYEGLFEVDEKVRGVLGKLGNYRNAITHLGIDFTDKPDELLCCFTETFDVIFNNLYPELLELDEEARYYFEDCDEDFMVRTPEGVDSLVGEDGYYNNFFDFTHELLTDLSQEIIMDLCSKNPDKRILKFFKTCEKIRSHTDYMEYFKENNLDIQKEGDTEWLLCEYANSTETTYLAPVYSSYYNATIYFDDSQVVFIVPHYENKIYHYMETIKYPVLEEPENVRQWEKDLEDGKCRALKLSAKNLFEVLKSWCEEMNDILAD
ncbi:hypothetical protein NRIC_21440 [Enterococcus florum]|uniref:Uncharacterized protein n=1 Tax=Enterococcus florum TaxID=2480627 RepID=A0A4P5PLW5_9ENTE|nr:hypothetical protein [Enterococcus florum]GCF94253.1 hypothetical protein NRIC_21440 [Enterococcus florum]